MDSSCQAEQFDMHIDPLGEKMKIFDFSVNPIFANKSISNWRSELKLVSFNRKFNLQQDGMHKNFFGPRFHPEKSEKYS